MIGGSLFRLDGWVRLLLAGCLLAGCLLVVVGCSTKKEAGPPRNAAPRVLVIGVDGVDPDLLELLVARDLLPNFAGFLADGFYGPLESREPLLSPLLWTTIATGRAPQDHGVLDFVEVAEDGALVPVGSHRRKVPALWNMLGMNGLSSGVLGWYASHPAEAIDGWVVSDRLGHHQVSTGELDERAVWPPELRLELGELDLPEVRIETTQKRFLPSTGRDGDLSEDALDRLGELARIHATSERYTELALELSAARPTDLLMLYYEQVDACSHLFMEDASFDSEASDVDPLARVVERCYVYQDEVLGRLLEIAGPDTLVLVVSDHGFKSGELRPRASGRVRGGKAAFWHRRNGVLLGRRGGSGSGAVRIEGASILDLVPTILAHLGIPIAVALPGEVLEEVAGVEETGERSMLDYSFEPTTARIAVATSSDRDQIERLAALGYLADEGDNNESSPGSAPESLSKGRVGLPDGSTVSALFNSALAHAFDGERGAAVELYRQVLELSPNHVDAALALAREAIDSGDLEEASALVESARRVRPDDSAVHLIYATWALAAERSELAASAIDTARALDDRVPMLYLLSARLENRRGRGARARAELAKGIALAEGELLGEMLLFDVRIGLETGDSRGALDAVSRARSIVGEEGVAAALGELELAFGNWSEAARLLRVASERNESDPLIARRLGQALAAEGDMVGAERAFRRSLRLSRRAPDRAGALADLSLLFQKQGDEQEVLRVLSRAVDELPAHGGLWGMLGAAYGRQRRYDEAIRAFEASVRLEPTTLGLNSLAALLLDQRDDRTRAAQLMRQSLALEANQPEIRSRLERLTNR